jgi:hypothetical protein
MSSMMAATRSRRNGSGKSLEDRKASNVHKTIEKIKEKSWRGGKGKATSTTGSNKEPDDCQGSELSGPELPYMGIKPLAPAEVVSELEKESLHREPYEPANDSYQRRFFPTREGAGAEATQSGEPRLYKEPGFKNRAPLQVDERVRDLIKIALQNPISLTAEDLLNVSEPMRQELKRLVTKSRVEKKTVTFAADTGQMEDKDEEPEVRPAFEREFILAEGLPDVAYEILEEDQNGLKKGAIVVGDPVLQYLSTLLPGQQKKEIVVAKESHGLRAVYPLINNVGEVESLLDGGSQIVSMSREVAVDLEVSWDPDITVQMESANRSLERTLGLARNVPFLFGQIRVYLQVHVMENPAYKVLLGRPFDTITESWIKNERDGSQSLTLTDPNTGERCVMHTHERGRPPTVLRKPRVQDFRMDSMN